MALESVDAILTRALEHLQRRGDPREVIPELLSIEGYIDEHPEIALALGTAYLDLQMPPEAVRYLSMARDRLPNSGEASFNLAMACRLAGRPVEAIEELRRFFPYAPREVLLVTAMTLASLLLAEERPREALLYVIRALESNPTIEILRYFQSLSLQIDGENLVHFFLRHISHDRDPRVWMRIPETRVLDLVPHAEFLAMLARLHSEGGAYGEATDLYARSFDEHDSDSVLGELGYHFLRVRRFGEAIAVYEKLVHRFPDNESAHFGLGTALFLARRDAEAAACLERIAVFTASRGHGSYMLGVLAHRRGDLDEARTRLRAALALAPRAVPALRALASAAREAGDIGEATECEERLRNMPRLIATIEGKMKDPLGVMPVFATRAPDDRVSLEEANALWLRLRMSSPGALDIPNAPELNRTAITLLNHDHTLAAGILERAVALYPDHLDSFNNLAYVLLRAGSSVVYTRDGEPITLTWDLLRIQFWYTYVDVEDCRIVQAARLLRTVLARQPDHLHARLNLLGISMYLERWWSKNGEFGHTLMGEIETLIPPAETIWAEVLGLLESGRLLRRMTLSRNLVYYAADDATNLAARLVFKHGPSAIIDREEVMIRVFAELGVAVPQIMGRQRLGDGHSIIVFANEGSSLADVVEDLRTEENDSPWLRGDGTAEDAECWYMEQTVAILARIARGGAERAASEDWRLKDVSVVRYDWRADLRRRFEEVMVAKLGNTPGSTWASRFAAAVPVLQPWIEAGEYLYYKDSITKNWLVSKHENGTRITAIDFESALLAPSQFDLVNLLEGPTLQLAGEDMLDYVQQYHELVGRDRSFGFYLAGYYSCGIVRHCVLAGVDLLAPPGEGSGSSASYHFSMSLSHAHGLLDVVIPSLRAQVLSLYDCLDAAANAHVG